MKVKKAPMKKQTVPMKEKLVPMKARKPAMKLKAIFKNPPQPAKKNWIVLDGKVIFLSAKDVEEMRKVKPGLTSMRNL